jgi:hypothetical protein
MTSPKQREIRSLVKRFHIHLLCIVETRVKRENSVKIHGDILPGWSFAANYECHYNGRIWICWDPNFLKVDIISKSMQEISCKIEVANEHMVWFHSFVYGANKGIERRTLWHSLKMVKIAVNSSPWLIGGDFNVVMHSKEKWGKDNLNSYELEFRDCLNTLEVSDLNFSGSLFTWCNKQEASCFVAKKLDRVLANEAWMGLYGNTQVDFLEAGVSDHSPSVITVGRLKSFGPRPFKFFSYWAENPDFLAWVSEGWRLEVTGVPMFCLYARLKAVKQVLKEKTLVCYGAIHQKVACARDRLEQAQKDVLLLGGQADCLIKEKECLHEFLSISKAEEAYFKQKSRVKWLNLGDHNSSYFHKMIKIRTSRNLITHLWDGNGVKVDEENQIKQVAVDFYEKLLGTESLSFDEAKAGRVSQLITKRVSATQYAMLQAEVTDAEIKATVFAMKNDKAPGPDGFPIEFFKKSWSVVGADVLELLGISSILAGF